MVEPTEEERQIAREVWNEALCNSEVPAWSRDEFFARALAIQRVKIEATAKWRAEHADEI